MKFNLLILLSLICSLSLFSQEKTVAEIGEDSSRWSASLDIVNRYLWRGQAWGGNQVAFQPEIDYQATEKLSFTIWATTNFQNRDYAPDNETPRGYQEIDLGISYDINDFMTIGLWDYYWPTLEKYDDADNSFFNFGEDGVQSLDLSLSFDLSEVWLPFNATISTLIGGNDYRYNENDNASRNYTTYVELGYSFEQVYQEIGLYPVLGAVLNNQAEYYTYASYDKVSFINFGVQLYREFSLNDSLTLPITLTYTHNAATSNLEPFGRNFLIAGLSLEI